MLRKLALPSLIAVACSALLGVPAVAAPPTISGAIFTTDSSGTPVNLNIYQAKEDVYLNGGPGINAPAGAAGLPDGTYSFQVTEPDGAPLSSDPVSCRQFTVSGGVIQDVVAAGGCEHATGSDGEDGGATVQLFPYNDTTNPGGVYKVWVTPTSLLDCNAPGNKNCFVPRYSKVDNFKVRTQIVVEIDARFHRPDGSLIDGMAAEWTDTNGATNVKYSEYNPAILAFHEAHVEAAEQGTHKIRVADQPGCTIGTVDGNGSPAKATGKSVVFTVNVAGYAQDTYFVDVYCK
ncbi:hypothetical protein [Sinomonas flava]|uniref:hypothetical protein n=1 Tax=Sinomonas flava TaxID=496857 RepID=UPI0039A52C3A